MLSQDFRGASKDMIKPSEILASICSFISFCAVVALLHGCEQQENLKAIQTVDKTVQAESANKRFSAEFHGEFRGGYNDHIRHIFVITDAQTRKQYLSITGCGTTELITRATDDGVETIEE
jgi:hypothetical protein